MLARDSVYTKRGTDLVEDRLAELHISGCLLFVLLFRSIRTTVLSPVDTRANVSGFVTNVLVPHSVCRLHTKHESAIKTIWIRHESENF